MLFAVLTDVTEPLWRDLAGSTRLLEVRFGRPRRALNRPTWSPVKGSSASVSSNRLSYGCPTTILWIPATDTDIISAQHFWTGGLETAGPGCYEAVVIARAAGFRMLAASVMRRLSPYSITVRSRAKQSCQNVPKNRCRTTKAERMGGNASGTALYRGSDRLFRPRPGR